MPPDADTAQLSLEQVFGQVLREQRKARGLTQERLAFESGLHPTYISLLERGIRGPSLDAVFRLAKALGLGSSNLVREVELRSVAELAPGN